VRIFPAYWVALTALAVWPGLLGVFSGHWFAYYGLIQLYKPDTWGLEGLGTAWTLCVEVTFYLALPLVAALLQNRGAHSGHRHALRFEFGVVGALALLSLVWRSIFFPIQGDEYLGLILPGTFSWFCAGMLLASVQMTPTALGRLRAALGDPWWCWTTATALLALFLLEPVQASFEMSHLWVTMETVQITAIAAFLVAPAVLGDRRRLVRLAVANRTMIFLGTVSYGIYLWHLPLVEWLMTTSIVRDSPAVTMTEVVFGFGLTLAMATLSWFLIEKPLMTRVRSVKAIASPSPGREQTEPAPVAPIAEPAP
jgi:peptidoglycan/LPS O-acetylase OafA/YrhL